MTRPRACRLGAWFAAVCLTPAGAAAQPSEAVGVRALGMGGAFVAVADDATAVYWNPAGLATGAYFSTLYERLQDETLVEEETAGAAQAGARRGTANLFALSTPVIGLAHYRLQQSVIVGSSDPAGAAAAGREDPGSQVRVVSLTTRHTAFAFAQTLWTGMVAGGTVRWVRGAAVADTRPGGTVAGVLFDRIGDLVARPDSTFDLDAGAMYTSGRARLGLVVRNLRAPHFDTPDGERFDGSRQARAGAAFTDGTLTLALDADLTRTRTFAGERRTMSLGGERWLRNRRLGVRAGVRVSTLGARRPAGALGASFMLRSRLYADAQVTRGEAAADRGWGVSLRVAY